MFVMQLHASRAVVVTSATWFCLVNFLTRDTMVTSGLLSDVIIHMHLCNLKNTQIQAQGESWKDRGLGEWEIGRGGPKKTTGSENTRVGRRKKQGWGPANGNAEGLSKVPGVAIHPRKLPGPIAGLTTAGTPGAPETCPS